MATETTIIETWLYAILAADTGAGGIATLSTGGIHQYYDSTGNTTYPKVIFRFQGGSDVVALGGRRCAIDSVYAVYAIWTTPSFAGTLDTIAARIDVLLQAKSGTAAGGTVLGCVRRAPLKLVINEDGSVRYALGGIYRIHSQQ